MSGGGVRLNMIPRDGGNSFNGSVFAGYQDQEFPDRQPHRRVEGARLKSADGIDQLSNVEASLGGPIKKDRVWFFLSARTFHLDTLPADALQRGRLPGVDPQSINSGQARIIWQISAKNKLSVYNDRSRQESRRGDDGRVSIRRRRPSSGIRRSTRPGPRSSTSTLTNRLLFEGGVLDQLRALQLLVRSRASRSSAAPGVVRRSTSRTSRSATTYNAAVSQQLQSSGPVLRGRVAVLRLRHAQHQGRASRTAGATTAAPTSPTATSVPFFTNGVPTRVDVL